MSFKENLLQKIEIDRLAARIMASCRTPPARPRIDRQAMQRLLELSPYRHQRERDLDLYVKKEAGEIPVILVLDNELPIFRTTIEDVVVRRSPRTLELWSFRTVRKILVDSDIKISTNGQSVATVHREAIGRLDLTYTTADIENLAGEGVTSLAKGDASGVEETLALFAALLGYEKPPTSFGLGQTVCYGQLASGPARPETFGPLVIYRPAANHLAWLDEPLARSDPQQMRKLGAIAAGTLTARLTGEKVFQELQARVPAQSRFLL